MIRNVTFNGTIYKRQYYYYYYLLILTLLTLNEASGLDRYTSLAVNRAGGVGGTFGGPHLPAPGIQTIVTNAIEHTTTVLSILCQSKTVIDMNSTIMVLVGYTLEN